MAYWLPGRAKITVLVTCFLLSVTDSAISINNNVARDPASHCVGTSRQHSQRQQVVIPSSVAEDTDLSTVVRPEEVSHHCLGVVSRREALLLVVMLTSATATATASTTQKAPQAPVVGVDGVSTTHAILEWRGVAPSFCSAEFRINLSKVRPTPETISAIFGARDPDSIAIFNEQGKRMATIRREEEGKEDEWPLERGGRYGVLFLPGSTDASLEPPLPFRNIYSLLGDDAEATLHRLSLLFYNGIWADKNDPEFRSLFIQAVSSPKEAADNQSRWLIETWGGPQRYTEKNGPTTKFPKKRALAKHSSKKRMNLPNAKTWLEHMKGAVMTELCDYPMEVRRAVGLYWAHFFAFFPFSDAERREIRHMTSVEWLNPPEESAVEDINIEMTA